MKATLSNTGLIAKELEVSELKESFGGAPAGSLTSAKRIKKAAIINLINHIHFAGSTIRVHVHNPETKENITVMASPEPCVDENLTAHWIKHEQYNPADYILLNIIINYGKSIIVVPVETIDVTEDKLIAALPVKGYVWNRRKSRRYPATDDVNAEIIQDNIRICGSLKEFSSADFLIKPDEEFQPLLDKLDTAKPFFVELRSTEPAEITGEEIVYSGFCSYKRTAFQNDCSIVLSQENALKNRTKRENRNPRLKLVPAPKIIFNHPLLNKTMELEVTDISSAGFAMQLRIDESPLMPGLFIKELYIVINGSINLKCTASVVYQLSVDEKNIKYGFSILDMEMDAFNRLFAIVCNADNPHINLSPELDIDSLWEFFFKSKFIYPRKYKLIESRSSEIRDIYNRLYRKGREIFTYITYQENGKIFGHCSIIRAYQRSWLVQHLAAISTENTNKTGIHILDHVLNYLDIMFILPAFKIDYLMFFYQPDNRFSEHFFGGVYKEANNPGRVTLDTFAYLSCAMHSNTESLYKGFIIEEINSEDYETLDNFYQEQSGGGLLVKSLRPDMDFNEEPLEKIYKKIQLTRSCNVYSLKEHNELKAVFIIDRSDIGINMSELLNCIKIIIVDMDLPWENLNNAINVLGRMYYYNNISVMVYPVEYLNLNYIVTDRYYNLWIIDTKYGHEYIDYLKQWIDPTMPSLLN
ncbi:MAG: hypothetical protein V1874_10145 [Spirochaetota bacterium]